MGNNKRCGASAKEIRTLISSSLALVMAAAILICASISFAWFSENRQVGGNGMKVSAAVTPNLIIAGTAAELSETVLNAGDPYSVTWDEDEARHEMLAATRADNTGTELKYVTNPEAIAIRTGLAKSGETLQYATVPTSADSLYYVDYTVYIASQGIEMEATSLTARLVSAADAPDTHLAMTVDFYLDSVSADNYKGTRHLATAASDSPVVLTPAGTVPCATDGYVKVVMRCYFDGALQKNGTTAYVNTYSVKTTGLSLDVLFEGVEVAG